MQESYRDLDLLRDELGPDSVLTDPQILSSHLRDMAVNTLAVGMPCALVRARSTADVVKVVRWAAARGVPVVPRGAGSGLAGGANAVTGSVVLSLERMNAILRIDPEDQRAVVQPGVVNADLSAAVRQFGLFYPPDPASKAFSTIGGNIATNAGGLCCLKYGVTRDFVLGLTVVLGDGRILHTGRQTTKGVAGYDLTSLLVGSEGTLGIVTEATLRLAPMPKGMATLAAFFSTLNQAGQAVTAIIGDGEQPSLLEIMDQTTIKVTNQATRMGLDEEAAALLIAQSDLEDQAAQLQIARLRHHCESAGATYVAETADRNEGEQLLMARREAFPALERLGTTLLDDVAVPRTKICDLLAAVTAIAEEVNLTIGTFGHAGDGNMHPTVVYDASDADQVARAMEAFERIVHVALELGGTVTGEHGVGLLKRDYLAEEIGPVAMDLHHRIKAAFDPNHLFNPGKVFTRT